MEDLTSRRFCQFAACLLIIHAVAFASGKWFVLPLFFVALVAALVANHKLQKYEHKH